MKKRVPRYKIVYETIKGNIEEDIYPEGSLLPSENEMCSLFGVTRPTVRKALIQIENQGYIKRHHGKGSIVQKKHHRLGILSIKGVTEVLGTQGNLTTKMIEKPSVCPWPDAFKYELTPEEKCYGCIMMKRLRFVDAFPIMIEIIYLVNSNLPRFCNKRFEKRSLFRTLRNEYKVEVLGGEQNIKAIKADDHFSQLLQVSEGHPILHLEGILSTSDPSIRIFVDTYCSTDKYHLFGSF
jgi:GntR family transcriptional regulator/GntR family frlABCD operon transcriptional regulator